MSDEKKSTVEALAEAEKVLKAAQKSADKARAEAQKDLEKIAKKKELDNKKKIEKERKAENAARIASLYTKNGGKKMHLAVDILHKLNVSGTATDKQKALIAALRKMVKE